MNLQHIIEEIEYLIEMNLYTEIAEDEDLGDDIWALLPIICKNFDIDITDTQAERLTTIYKLACHINERLNGDKY